MAEEVAADRLCQKLTLTLEGGRKIHYFGRAQLTEETPERVTSVAVSLPAELPAGLYWEGETLVVDQAAREATENGNRRDG